MPGGREPFLGHLLEGRCPVHWGPEPVFVGLKTARQSRATPVHSLASSPPIVAGEKKKKPFDILFLFFFVYD